MSHLFREVIDESLNVLRLNLGYDIFDTWHQELKCLPPIQGALGLQLAHSNFQMNLQQGSMEDQIIASHTCFGGYMDVSCQASLYTLQVCV